MDVNAFRNEFDIIKVEDLPKPELECMSLSIFRFNFISKI